MFIGHFALGLAAMRVVPRPSLLVLFAAAQLADILWPVFVALGLEQVRIDVGNTAFTPLDFVSYPYSHSLLLLAAWGAVFGLAYRARTRDTFAGWMICALVISHWLFDFVTHRPDMPPYPGGPKLGLGLWNHVPATIAVECAVYGWGVGLYLSATRARDNVGRWPMYSLLAFLVVAYFANLSGPPPSIPALWMG